MPRAGQEGHAGLLHVQVLLDGLQHLWVHKWVDYSSVINVFLICAILLQADTIV